MSRVTSAADHHIPIRNTRSFATPRPSRVSQRLHRQMQELTDNIHANSQERRELHRQYVDLRKQLLTNLQQDIQNFYKDLFAHLLQNGMQRDFWKTYKAFTKEKTHQNNSMITADGQPIPPDEEITHLTRHFHQQFQITAAQNANFCPINEQRIDAAYHQWQINNPTPSHFQLYNNDEERTKTTLRDVKEIISKLGRKAPGFSQINKQLLSQLPNKTIIDLVEIYNASLQAGVFPNPFKQSVIIPIQKPNKERQPQNFRPISLLEYPAKILEQLAIKPLLFTLEDHNVLLGEQHGFRTSRGTDTALALMYETISVQSRTRAITITSRDVSGAFDRVWHTGLKHKITNLELPSSLKRFFCSYLDDRTAKVKYKQKFSQPFSLLAGVPQGAILSPTLYNIYLADLPQIRNIGRISCFNCIYADDVTQIVQTDYQRKRQEKGVASMTKPITEYEKRWKISTNPSKFQIMPLHTPHPASYHLPQEVKPTKECKILGLKLTKSTRRENHALLAHLNERLAIAERDIWKIAPYSIPISTKLTLYKVLIRSKITYPAVIMNTIDNLTMKSNLQKLQNKAIRVLAGINPLAMRRCSDLHQQYNIEPINIYLQRLATKTWDKIQALYPDIYEELQAPLELRDSRFPSSLQKTLEIQEPFYTRPRLAPANRPTYRNGRRR